MAVDVLRLILARTDDEPPSSLYLLRRAFEDHRRAMADRLKLRFRAEASDEKRMLRLPLEFVEQMLDEEAARE